MTISREQVQAAMSMPVPGARVWDVPTRVLHGLLGVSFAVAWVTREDDRYLDVHALAGYLMLGLLLMRLVWGVMGTRHARFASFAFGLDAVRDYLARLGRGAAPRHVGHNPAGAWAIFALLGLGLMVTASGLIVLGGEERHGPLAGLLSFEQAALVRPLHEALAIAMLALVGVHVLGVVVESLLHRENLVAAMVHGRKAGTDPQRGVAPFRLLGAGVLVVAAATVLWHLAGYLRQTPERPYRPFVGPSLPDDPLWRQECGSCHLAYHPSLLPRRSWERLMAGQVDHFGEDLALDGTTTARIRAFLVANAAEAGLTEPSWKINGTLPAGETPLQITRTPYWVRKHRDISQAQWRRREVGSRGNCAACHLDARQGTFEDAAMRLPRAAPSGAR